MKQTRRYGRLGPRRLATVSVQAATTKSLSTFAVPSWEHPASVLEVRMDTGPCSYRRKPPKEASIKPIQVTGTDTDHYAILRTEEPPPPIRTVVALSRSMSVGDITVDTALVETNPHGRSLQTYSDHGISDSICPIKRNQIVTTTGRVDKAGRALVDYTDLKKQVAPSSVGAKEFAFKVKALR
jgi:hypothetical protein